MGYWQQRAVTDIGNEMLNDLLAGRKLTICSAYGGTEMAGPEELTGLADVCGERHELGLLGLEKSPEGKIVRVQINNVGVEQGYQLHQIGVFAKVDDGPEQMLFILQDEYEKGIEIPSVAENPNFSLEVQGLIYITNDVEIRISLEGSSAVITLGYLNEAMEAHNSDPDAHQEIWRRLGKRVLATRVRDPTKPDYGMIQNNVQGRAAILDAAPYTGGSEVSAIVNGVEYDVSNMSANGAGSPDGTLLLKKLEE